MERISIFNYEAFYLDFLEGNLNEEDTALLMSFLEANPDLKMDDETLPVLATQEVPLDVESKKELKQPSMGEKVTADNVDYFMIAAAENLLNKEKQKELEAFVANNKSLEKERMLYGAVYFEPDLSVGYAEKADLKQKVVVIWQYVSIAAAASVIAFFLVWSSMSNDSVTRDLGTFTAKGQQGYPQNNKTIFKLSADELENNEIQLADHGLNDGGSSNNLANTLDNGTIQRLEKEQINRLERRPVGSVLTADNREVEPITNRVYPSTKVDNIKIQQNDVAYFSAMENPIEPITKLVGEKTNTEVDFRRTDKNKEGKRGFFVKIGKFEFSRKRH